LRIRAACARCRRALGKQILRLEAASAPNLEVRRPVASTFRPESGLNSQCLGPERFELPTFWFVAVNRVNRAFAARV
jgi:hypothetical protein